MYVTHTKLLLLTHRSSIPFTYLYTICSCILILVTLFHHYWYKNMSSLWIFFSWIHVTYCQILNCFIFICSFVEHHILNKPFCMIWWNWLVLLIVYISVIACGIGMHADLNPITFIWIQQIISSHGWSYFSKNYYFGISDIMTHVLFIILLQEIITLQPVILYANISKIYVYLSF